MGVPTPEMVAAAIAASQKSAIEKVERLYTAEVAFHEAAATSLRHYTTAAVNEFRYKELVGTLNALIEKNQYSIGKFLIDLMLVIAFGPVLGSVMGRAIGNQMSAIIHWRKAMIPLKKLAARTAKGPITQADEAALRQAVKGLAITGLAKTELPSRAVYRLSDFSTGVVVDSFQTIGAAVPVALKGASDNLPTLGHLVTQLQFPPQDLTKDVTINAAPIEYVPTILQSILDNADNYLLAQRKIAFEMQKILRAVIVLTDTDDGLATIHKHLDDSLKQFEDQLATDAARRQMNNICTMLGLLLIKGDPAGWSRMVTTHSDYAEYPSSDEEYEMAAWPDLLLKSVLNSIWIPGTQVSYYHRYLKIKQIQLGREKGAGIDKRGYWKDRVDKYPLSADWSTPGNLLSPQYTAQEAAFWYLQKFMEQLYKELTSQTTNYNAEFSAILQRAGLSVSK